jgi:hypothetical protein
MAMSGATESRKSRAEAPEKMNEVEAKEKVQQKTSKREAGEGIWSTQQDNDEN